MKGDKGRSLPNNAIERTAPRLRERLIGLPGTSNLRLRLHGAAAHRKRFGSAMTVNQLIREAEAILPGTPAAEGDEDPRWQAIIAIGEHVESHPEEVWQFVARWGASTQEDLRDAVATCLLEHLLEHHFDSIFPRVQELVKTDRMFGETFIRSWKFGQAELPENATRFDELRVWCKSRRGA